MALTTSTPVSAQKQLIRLMAFSVAVIVGNVYYAQPLLAQIAHEFHLTVQGAGALAMSTQAGVATGMLLFVPLGDMLERRRLIFTLLLMSCLALVGIAMAPGPLLFALAGFFVGMFGSVVHVIVPFAAEIAPPGERGKVLGIIFSGVLCGVLLARTFSGFVGARFGWRAVFWIASVGVLSVASLLRWKLPVHAPAAKIRWTQLMRSVAQLARDHAELREAAFIGAASFGAFSAFWTTLAFRLEAPPLHYGASVAGLFGLVGAAGAGGAPLFGRLSDKRGPKWTIEVALLIALGAFAILGVTGSKLIGLTIGVIILDLGVQAAHVANQTRIYAIAPDARSRLNTVYMVAYFVGGGTGSYFGAVAWHLAGWWGVCGLGMAFIAAAIAAGSMGSTSRYKT